MLSAVQAGRGGLLGAGRAANMGRMAIHAGALPACSGELAVDILRYAGRPEYASPAAGTTKRHGMEQGELVNDAFAPRPVTRAPRGSGL